ncbi:MAG TPA: CoA transferase, partial [Acidimicrobiales bacterium]|nr:CoA transferase [Acidimicrobiales bacterium]
VEAFSNKGVPNSPLMYMLLICLTKDGRWLQFAQVAPHLYAAFMKALGLDWMFGDPEWKGLPVFDDEERRVELWVRMLEAAGTKTLAEWEAVFEADPNVFAELFRSGPEVLDHPQLVHDHQVVEIADLERGPVRQPAALAQLEGYSSRLDRPAPCLGDYEPTDLGDPGPAEPPEDAPASLPLAGVTVLELAVLYAAPYGATLLTDLGARVIKVEPLTGDPIRMMVAFPEAGGAKVMQGKESIAVDINKPEGLAIVHQLAERADAVLEGFRAGAAERHGVDAASLQARNPSLVYVSANGYGPGEPCGSRPAFAPSIAAAGGLARANVGPTVPEEAGLSTDAIREAAIRLAGAGTVASAQSDGFAALGVATSLLLGLVARQRTGAPQHVQTSMLSTSSHAMADHVVDFVGNPGPPDPGRELRGPSARYRIYDASDGWVFLAAPQEREWDALADALAGHIDLRADERFATEVSRRQNDAALAEVLTAVFVTGTKDVWERELLAADVGCVAVTTSGIESTLMSDDFGRASGYLADVDHPTFDHHPRLAPLVRFSRSATQAKPGVVKGSHTDAILDELGYGSEAIADLRSRDVIA